ncbi:MAG: C25 family cysteine peptidase [candidate division WOR-3 bacterium]
MTKLFCLLALPLLALAGTVVKTVSFDPADVKISRVDGYDVVQLADCNVMLDLGKPMLPEAVFNVIVPATATVTGINVEPAMPEKLPGTHLVYPAQPPVILSSRTRPEFVPPDPSVYSSSSVYPAELVQWSQTGTKSGWRVCGFLVRPMSYVPATGELTLYRRMTVTVSYVENSIEPIRLTRSQLDCFRAGVAALVLNPEDVDRFAPPRRVTDGMDCDYAIITNSSLAPNFQSLAAWRTKKGYYTRIFRTDSIQGAYPGRDLQEKIRNFIIDYFINHGLKFVLLAGDNSIVPCRRARVTVDTETGNIPSDLYYADLQWSWDGNNNNIFGEMSGDTVDLFYDVYVGRASVDNSTQANTFVNKVLAYEKTPTADYLQRMLLPYVQLWSGYSGKVVSDSIANQTPSGWRDAYIANPTSTGPMRDSINNGYHFCHVAAHGDDYGFYDMYGSTIYNTSTAGGQTNSSRPVIMNSIACISGNFEAEDCLAEAVMNNANGGAVAAIMNSRYGWGTPPTMGPSEKLDNKFYDFLFRFDSVEIGVTHARGKDFYTASAQSQPVWRWCYYELNLFGDPNMPMWKQAPSTMTSANADTITTGAQSFQVIVSSGGSRVPGALVCCYKPGETHEVAWTNWNGIANVTINPVTTGQMHLTVTAKQMLPLEKTVTVIQGTPQPFVVYQSHYVDDGGNHQLDPGETADLFVTVKNMGSVAATNTQGKLRTASSYIAFSDSTSDYGTINSGDTSRGDRYRVTASGSTPPGTVITFTVHVTSSEGSWDPTFQLTVGAPSQPGSVVMDHDTGYCKLSVSALGSIGYDEPPALDLGAGFSYPKTSASQLFYSSLLIGNSTSYVADRFYSQPPSGGPNTDFRIVDSLRPVLPPSSGDEHFRARFNDGGHATPKGLRVTQHSHQCAAPGYDDFVVLAYDIANTSGSAVNGLYAGIFADFDIGSSPTTNTAASDTVRRLTYMRQSSSANPSVGVKILAPASFANLIAIDHARWVYPDSCMTDGQKFRILNGTIVQRNSNRNYDWSVGTSVGPFDLAPGASQRVAFAFVGGISEANLSANADSAQSWYDRNTGIFEEEQNPGLSETHTVICTPNPFWNKGRISYQARVPGRVLVQVFDVTGRNLATLADGPVAAGRHEANWSATGLAGGVYLVKVTQSDGTTTAKLLLAR